MRPESLCWALAAGPSTLAVGRSQSSSKPAASERPAQGLGGEVEAVARQVERPPVRPEPPPLRRVEVGHGDRHRPARPQRAVHGSQRRQRVGDVLEAVVEDRGVEALIREIDRLQGSLACVDPALAREGARLRRGLDPDHLPAMVGEDAAQVAAARAHVQQPARAASVRGDGVQPAKQPGAQARRHRRPRQGPAGPRALVRPVLGRVVGAELLAADARQGGSTPAGGADADLEAPRSDALAVGAPDRSGLRQLVFADEAGHCRVA